MDLTEDSIEVIEDPKVNVVKQQKPNKRKPSAKKQAPKKDYPVEAEEKEEVKAEPEEKQEVKAEEVKAEVSEAPVKRKKTGAEIATLTISIALLVLMVPILFVNVALILSTIFHPQDVPAFFNLRPMIVLSDSMYPMIKTNDLIVSKAVDPATLEVGDVISYRERNSDGSLGAVVTHKIIQISIDEENVVHITTTGINNVSYDSNGEPIRNSQGELVTFPDTPITGDQVIGKYVTRLPGFGGVIYWMQSVWGLIVCIGVPVAAFIIYELVKRNAELKAERRTSESANTELEELRAKLRELEKNDKN